MSLKETDPRVLDCVRAKEESRRRAGRPPRGRDVLVAECKRQIAQSDWREAHLDAEIQMIRRLMSCDLSDTDLQWIELEDYAANVHDGTDPHALTARLLADAIVAARRDPTALLRELGLAAPRGAKSAANAAQRLLWGRLLASIEDETGEPGKAMQIVQAASDDRFSETTLRAWRDAYRKRHDVSNGK
ncbi:hypothetical protein [Thiomonas sp.]